MYKILIIDDEYTNQYVLKKMLREYELAFLENTEQAIKKILEFKPDLLLLDIMLPLEDGFQFLKRLKENNTIKNTPVIFVSAKNESEDIFKGLEVGAYDYVTKPIDELILKARIKLTLKKSEKEKILYNNSVTDSLTLIHNRKYFFENASNHQKYASREKKNFSIAVFDIDFFKKINDIYGHSIGDYILKEFANELKKNLRPYDLLARYGGEEFVILFIDCDKEHAKLIVDRIRKNIEKEIFTFEDYNIQFTFSCGISDFVENNYDIGIGDLFNQADERLYIAKKSGRNMVINKSDKEVLK